MRELTVAEFAELCQVDRNIAGQVLRFFEKQGQVRIVTKRKSSQGRGKPATIYGVPDTLVYDLPTGV